ncbi:hypothetical protein Lgee_1164 [Legionella geestiana]|uniref:Prepilin-type N-terminal cleavage/methylation domain-containing protein n=2 Tax=Legionella geestiana TaxID=45065 RepID=A0A0W0TWC6_9GAMM|nr:hypothetical protein Lgee_1164 [Legionella geestiana]STX54273.1 Tfp pilus assembly protein PilE [Legionella geestiana]
MMMKSKLRHQGWMRGFSLLETVIVLALAAILAAVAWPSWNRHLVRTHRDDAQMALLALAAGMQAWHLATHTFDTDVAPPGANPPKPVAGLSPLGGYRLHIKSATKNDFLLEAHAEPTIAAADPACRLMTLDRHGMQGEPAACWGIQGTRAVHIRP